MYDACGAAPIVAHAADVSQEHMIHTVLVKHIRRPKGVAVIFKLQLGRAFVHPGLAVVA